MVLASSLWRPLLAQEKIFYLEEWYASGDGALAPHSRQASAADALGSVYLASSKLNEHGRNDLQLDKYSSSGALLWSQAFSLPDSTSDVLVGDLQVDNSGSIVVTGSVYNGAANGYDVLTAKYSTNGTKLWHSTYNGSASGDDGGAKLYIDGGNNIYVAGAALSTGESMNMLALRYSGSGVQQWAQALDGHGLYDAAGYLYRRGSELTVVGVVQQTASSWALGSVSFNLSTGTVSAPLSTSSQADFAEVLAVASDAAGNVYVAGYSNGSNGRDIVAAKLSWQLTLDWQASYDGPGSGGDEPRAIAVDSSGNVYIAGITESAAGDSDWLVLKYSSSGALQWASTYAGAAGSDDGALALSVGPQGEIAAAGYANEHGSKDYLTALLDPADGSFTWSAAFNGLANGDDEARQVLVDSTGSITVIGRAALHGEGSTDMALRYAKKTVLELPGATAAAAFVENRGQLADTSGAEVPQVKFYAPGSGAGLYVQDGRLSFVLSSVDGDMSTLDTMHRVDMSFHGGKTNSKAFGMGKRDSYHNYYLGHIPEGRARVGLYDKVILSEVYEGVDLQVRAGGKDGGQCFVVKPGGDPSDIKLQFEGQSSLAIDPGTGALEAGSPIGKLLFPQPSAFLMEADGDTEELNWQVAYQLLGDGKVGFDSIGVYDNGKSLVICVGDGDGEGEVPEREKSDWVTYFGGTGSDSGVAIDITEEGGIVILVETTGTTFPTITGESLFAENSGEKEALVSSFTSERTHVWSTFYGGTMDETPLDLALNLEGDVYIVGTTRSPSLPLGGMPVSSSLRGFSDGFIARFSSDGTQLKWASYLGGDSNDICYGVAVNSKDNVFLVGTTEWNQNFPLKIKPNAFNQSEAGTRAAFILEFDEDNEQVWGTLFGGSGREEFADLVIDENSDDLYILGQSSTMQSAGSTPPCGPASGGLYPDCNPGGGVYYNAHNGGGPVLGLDLVVVQFNSAGQLLWSTHLGGNHDDFAASTASPATVLKIGRIDYRSGALALIASSNDCSSFTHVPRGFFQSLSTANPIVARFENRELVESTCFNRGGAAAPYGLALDEQGNMYIAGQTVFSPPQSSADFCKETTGSTIAICPPGGSGIFFQDDDVNDDLINAPQANGGQEIFIAAFNASGDFVYGTLFGGNNGEGVGDLKWSGNNLHMTGSTLSPENFPLINPGPPAFFIDETSGLGRDAFIAQLCTVNLPTYIREQQPRMGRLSAFPNPTPGLVSIHLGDLPFNQALEVYIFDAMGREVERTRQAWEEHLEIDLTGKPSGSYFAVVKQGQKLYMARLMKM